MPLRQTRRAREIRKTRRTINKIEREGEQRAREIAQFIVDHIAIHGPIDLDRRPGRLGPEHLRTSYGIKPAPEGGEWYVTTDVRYWAFVEFGTKEHGRAQPHVRPAIEAARVAFG